MAKTGDHDVAPAAAAVQDAILRKMSPARKLEIARQMNEGARRMKVAALAAQHPDWDEAKINAEVRRIFICART